MAGNSVDVAPEAKPVILNLGCGWRKHGEGINVDGFMACEPDVLWDLNKFPYPWDDNSVDEIYAYHIFEHLTDWWGAFAECARILKPNGQLEIRVPDATSDTALAYRDHLHIISLVSFDGIVNRTKGRALNAWAASQEIVPMVLMRYGKVPFAEYNWMPKWLLKFCSKHFRNYIWEQRFLFKKVTDEYLTKTELIGHPPTEYLKVMKKYRPGKKEKVV